MSFHFVSGALSIIACLNKASTCDSLYEEEDYEDEEDVETLMTDDDLHDLLVRIRARLKKGDCQALYAVWETYGEDNRANKDEAPPMPRRTEAGAKVADELASIMKPM